MCFVLSFLELVAIANLSVFRPLAIVLLQNLYRWVSSPSARLYDVALHRLLHTLMKKVYFLAAFSFHFP